jgi:hypothetical protein
MIKFLSIIFLLAIFISCDKKPPITDPDPVPDPKTDFELMQGQWHHQYQDVNVYDTSGNFESTYKISLVGKSIKFNSNLSYDFKNSKNNSEDKTGSWQLQAKNLTLDSSQYKILLLNEEKLEFESPFIYYYETPGHGGPPTPTYKMRKEITYLKR